jgi:hypothetical protein
VVKPASVLDEHTASIFRVTESILIEAEAMWQEKMFHLFTVVSGNLVSHSIGGQKRGWDCHELI